VARINIETEGEDVVGQDGTVEGEAPARGRKLRWSLTLTALGPAFLVGGLIVVLGLILIGGLRSLVDFVDTSVPSRLSIMIIGALVAVIGLVILVSGWKGANRTMELQLAKKAAMVRRRKMKTT
jgi:hypothetical protein